jgi:exopolyphosphatase/guanosine-5'-triphosphate,3'-diphosphate pyrophosphatase
MKLAAIDIGSNAVRLQITNTLEYQHTVTFKKMEYIRFPLRLGYDVFMTGRISELNKDKFMKLMSAYKIMIDLYQVDSFYGCATSAMRESENGAHIIERVKELYGLDIQIIDGEEEARLINEAVKIDMEKANYLHVDVGGGSTELNYYAKGIMRASGSFKIGSVRRLNKKDAPEVWDQMSEWISKEIRPGERLTAIGTGGNINKLFELSKARKDLRKVSLDKLKEVVALLNSLTLEERMLQLQLNADRADVIIPASDIYIRAMELANVEKIFVPDVGLKDGINLKLYEQAHPNHDRLVVRN